MLVGSIKAAEGGFGELVCVVEGVVVAFVQNTNNAACKDEY